MIQINLLPPEYRPRTGTPVARFAAIVVGIVMVLPSEETIKPAATARSTSPVAKGACSTAARATKP